MNSTLNKTNSPALPQCGPEQDHLTNTAPPTRRQKKARTETSTRHKWSKEENTQLMKLYYQSNPSRSGYRQRLHSLWTDSDLFPRTEQQLAGQVRSIKTNKLLTDIELQEVQEIQGSIPPIEPNPPLQESLVEPSQLPGSSKRNDGPEDPPTVSQTIRNIRAAQSISSMIAQPAALQVNTEPSSSEQADIIEQLNILIADPTLIQVKPLRHVNWKKLKEETSVVNACLTNITTNTITDTNTLLLAGAHVVRERLGEKAAPEKPTERKEPFWKRRIEEKISQLRKDISYLEEMKSGSDLKKKILDGLNRRHPLLKKKGIKCVSEELKQRLRAKAAKIKRYNKRIDRYHQNKLFGNNQRQFYRNLNSQPEEVTKSQPQPNKEECLKYWKNIWEQQTEHNSDAEWLPAVREELAKAEEQAQFVITEILVTNRVKKMANWSSPGTDGLHAYWLKNFKGLHATIATQMMTCMTTSAIPEWMTTGRTYLLLKDHAKGPNPGNYRPITCLPAMWKLFTGLISDSIYQHLESQKLLPSEQKGCKKNSRGCKEQLMIDKLILKNCKRRKRNLLMTFIDYKKAYDRVPHSWIISCMTMCGISPTIIDLFDTSFKQSSVDLMVGKDFLGRVKIRRGIFQGDSVSPLHFIISLIPLSFLLNKHKLGYSLDCKGGPTVSHRLYMDDLKLYATNIQDMETLVNTTSEFSSDIKMEFGLDKCASIKITKGGKADFNGISLPDGTQIEELEDKGYKYLGILEADNILHTDMKVIVTKEYIRRTKKILKSQLHGKFCIQAINTWAVPVVRYGAGILNWTTQELKALDTKTRKLMRIHGAHHPQGDVDRLYVNRREGGRGLHSIEEVVRREENALTTFVLRSTDPEIVSLKSFFVKDKILVGKEIDKETDRSQHEEKRKERWTAKVMHGQYYRQMNSVADPTSWNWLTEQDLKRKQRDY